MKTPGGEVHSAERSSSPVPLGHHKPTDPDFTLIPRRRNPMPYSTLEEAWRAFAADAIDPFSPELAYRNAMEIAFYMGSAALYMAISEARTSEDPIERMQHLFDEMDFYMKSIARRTSGSLDNPGNA